jgi:uncharacterized membrane protein
MPLLLLAVASACGDDLRGAASHDSGVVLDVDAPATPDRLRLFDYFIAVGVTPDGTTALFEGFEDDLAVMVLVDTVTGEELERATLGDPSRVLATGIAADRRISALHGEPVEAAIWSLDDGWFDLGSPFETGCGSDVAGAWDLSADGEVVVGLAWEGCAPQAFRWTETDGFQLLERLGAAPEGVKRPPSNRATVVSADGAVIAGFAESAIVDRTPARWTADGTGEVLVPSDTDAPGEVLSINGDGTVLAGTWGFEGFVWTEADGLVPLPRLDGSLPGDPVFPNAMTAAGDVLFGGVGDAFFSIPTAFVWSEADGMRPLSAVAGDLPEGVLLNSVLGASADGRVLVGTAMDAEGLPKTFVLRLD